MNNLISIIVVNYNGRKWLEKLFDSLLCQTYQNFEIILVDNASSDDSLEFVKDNYTDSRIKLIKSCKNLGFAGGNNLGIEKSKGEFILLLNNDTWVDSNFIEKMIKSFIKNNLDVLAPKELDYFGKPLYCSDHRTLDIFGHPFFASGKINISFYLQGICLLFKKGMYKDTCGLDDNFFMYFEETDWFWRLNLLKKNIFLDKNITINHAGSGTSGRGIQYMTFLWRNQNTLQMLLKNYKWFNLIWVLPIYFIQNIFEIIFFCLILKPKIAYSYIQGWWFNVVNFKKIIQKRKWVQENRLVGDSEIMNKMYTGFAKLEHLLIFFKLKK